MNEKSKKDVLRETDEEARALATRLLREARYASLASLEADTGHPQASRVTIANEMDGTPIILVSDLSSHTPALRADKRCSLLIGELGKGDPLAHPRMTVMCDAEILERSSSDYARARTRFLNRHPKAALYIDFGDFHFFRLRILRISLNGGFGKAYALEAKDVTITDHEDMDGFYEMEQGVIDHMNEDHLSSIAHYVANFSPQKANIKKADEWRMAGVDPDGMDLISGDEIIRIPFPKQLKNASKIRGMLVALAKADK